MKKEQLPSWILALLLVSPFLIILSRTELNFQFDSSELLWAFSNSMAQAVGAAIFALLFGLVVMLGTLGVGNKAIIKVLPVLVMLPTVLPVLFIILTLFYLIDPFPMGWFGIVLSHTVIYAGAVGLSLVRTVQARFSQLAEVAYVMGASRRQFWKTGVLPGIKSDLFRNFILVFASAFTSFSIPLMVGGQRGTNLEVLIYEKIRIAQDWGSAVSLSLVQTVFLFLLFLVNKDFSQKDSSRVGNLQTSSYYFRFFRVSLLIFAIYGSFLLAFLAGIVQSLYVVQISDLNKFPWMQLVSGSLSIGLLSVFLLIGFFAFALFYIDNRRLRKFIVSFVAPSTALASFSFLLVFGSEGLSPYWTIPMVIVLLFLPAFYKLFWESKFQELEGQFETARVLGGSRGLILKRILWPQAWPNLQQSVFMIFAWAMSDFAVSRILSSKEISLASAIDNLLSGYRVHLAFVVCGILLVLIAVGLLIIKGVFHVTRHES